MATAVDRETDTLFWLTGYRPGHYLDPNDPNDAKMIPVWSDIHAKVQREFDAGRGSSMADHPEVVKNILDAARANQAGIASLDTAAATSDPSLVQQFVSNAKAAFSDAAQKLREVAKLKPPSAPSASPQVVQDAAQDAAASPPPPGAPARDQVAHEQIQAAHVPTPRGILQQETDARFWIQYHYRVGQKLDRHNPTDAQMIPVWSDVYRKVKAEDDAGRLVLTYNNPAVVQAIRDAQVADKVAATQIDAAKSAPDAATAQQHDEMASTATQVAQQQTRDAAQVQPPVVAPGVADRASAGAQVAPVHGPGRDQLAQQQAMDAGRRSREIHEHHKRHGRHKRSSVSRESLQHYRAATTQIAQHANAPYVLVVLHPDGTPEPRAFGSRAELDAAYAKFADQHDQYLYVAAFDLQAHPRGPIHDSVGVHAAEHVEVPGQPAGLPGPPPGAPSPDAPPGTPPSPPTTVTPPDTTSTPPTEEKPGRPIGKILAGVAVAVAGTLVYVMTRGKEKPTRRSRPRPKVFVATPTPAVPAMRARVPGASRLEPEDAS